MTNQIINLVYRDLEELKTIDQDDVWDIIVNRTISYDKWLETDDTWYYEVYKPMLKLIKKDFNLS